MVVPITKIAEIIIMIITELIGEWQKKNYKKPAAKDINRKNYDFQSLTELAEWSRLNYFLAFPQEEVAGFRRKAICNKLFLGTNLLWLDADYDVDVDDVKRRWKKADLRGFLYFTSRYYNEGIKRLRLCVKVKGLTLDNAKAYAEQVAKILNITKIDEHQYSSTAYYAPVRIVDKNPLQSTTPAFKDGDLWVYKGKRLALDIKPTEKQAKQPKKKTKTSSHKPQKLLDFGQFLESLDCVERTTVRDNNTANIIFKHIREKTPNGYFINPYENAWKINHPNNKRFFASEVFKDDFEKYKQYVVDNFSIYQPSSESKADETIITKSKYLKPTVFDNKSELLFVESPTGSGKTTSLSKWLKDHEDKSVLFISVNRAQAMQTHRALIKEGLEFECYLPTDLKAATEIVKDDGSYYLSEFIVGAKNGFVAEKVICGVLSLHHLISGSKLHRKFDYVIIDEITTLPRASINTLSLIGDNIFRFNKDMTALHYLLQGAEKVICLDGFIPSCIVEAIENISGKKKYHVRKYYKTNKKIEIYLTRDPIQPKFDGKITCKKFMRQLEHDIKHSKKLLLIGASYKKKAHQLYNYIRLLSKKSIERITNRLNNKKDILNFIKHLERNLRKLLILIYSPSITTGLDIPEAKGTNVYHLINGKHLSSHIHYQMSMRGRDANCYKILMPTYMFHSTSDIIDNAEDELLEKIQALYPLILSQKYFDTKSISKFLKDNSMGMGVVLILDALHFNKTLLADIIDKEALRTLLYNSKVGVYTAMQLEIANIALNNLDKKYSVGQQYINLLAHEGCKVSVELDTANKTSADKVHMVEEEIKLLNMPVTTCKLTKLYGLKNRYIFAQKILHFENGYGKSNSTIIDTHEVLTKAFKVAKIDFNSDDIEITNKTLVKMYNCIYNSINSKLDKTIIKKFSSHNLKDYVKIKRVVYLLNLFFITSRKHKSSKLLKIDKKQILHKSIQNISIEHKRLLYVNDEIAC